jgi:cation diffusion facilitator CzcD-associated flavoprotein CzcO
MVPKLPDIKALAARTADKPLKIPENLPCRTASSSQYRYAETSVYPHLETNIDAVVMEFSKEPIPAKPSELSIKRHGRDTPFRHHTVIQKYINSLLDRNGYQNLVEYNTTVEKVEKLKESGTWRLTLRRYEHWHQKDYWWSEDFDAVLVASGHYTVPFVPEIEGLAEFALAYPGSVEHSKGYRGVEKYRGKVNRGRNFYTN